MSRIMETTVYTFEELSDDARQNAINSLSDINVEYEWWDSVYDDASDVGIEITGFDLYRRRNCDAVINNPIDTANSIIKNHGETCDTYQVSRKFLDLVEPLVKRIVRIYDILDIHGEKYDHGLVNTSRRLQDEIDELKEDYCKDIREEYSLILQREYDYLTSSEAIIESIQVNGYEFTEKGEMI